MPWSDKLRWREIGVQIPGSWSASTRPSLWEPPPTKRLKQLTTSIHILVRMILSTFKISRSHGFLSSTLTLHELGFSTALA